VTTPKRPTENAARRMLADLKRTDRLDGVSEAVAALALVTGRMVDQAGGAGVKEYALAKLTTAHLGVLLALARLIEPIPASGDMFSEFMLDMAETQQAEAARAAFYRRHGHQPPWFGPS
jgi:hypothetical protein